MAIRTIANGGGNWTTASTWVEGIVPTTADDVVCTLTSGNVTINSGSVCGTIDFTNYSGSINLSATSLSVSGNITLSPTMTIIGSFGIAVAASATSTIVTNGKSFNGFTIGSVASVTLTSDVIVLNNFVLGNAAVNGYSITVGGSFSKGNTGGNSGTTSYIMNGTGSLQNSSTGVMNGDLTIDTLGTITIGSFFRYGIGTFRRVNGNVITTGSTLVAGVSSTWDTDGITWNNVTFNTGQTFISDFIVNGTFASSNGNTYNGANLILNGNLNVTQLTIGTTVFRYRGTGFWTGGGWIGNTMYIETDGVLWIAGGTYGSVPQVAKLIYVKGKITKNSTLQINATANLYGFGNGKVSITSITLLANAQLLMDDMFWGTPNLKTQINAQPTSRLYFTTNVQRKAYFVSLRGVVLASSGSLNVINRDGNRGGNVGVIFGERGMNGFPLNQFPTEPNYSFGDGLYNNMIL